MEVFSKSDIGLVRNQNQDDCRFGVISPSCVWAVVCDGMGGANGGNIASATAVDYISTKITDLYKDKFTCSSHTRELGIFHGHFKDFHIGIDNNFCHKLANLLLGHIKQLTEDHSLVQEMVRRGELTYEQAQNHPNKNFITRALGIKPSVRLDYIEANFIYGDVLLICTDGLSNCVTTGDMVKICHENRGEGLITKLVDKAKDGGGSDNITATVIY